MASHVTSPRASHQHHRHLFSLKNSTTSYIRFRDKDKNTTTQSIRPNHPKLVIHPLHHAASGFRIPSLVPALMIVAATQNYC